MVLLPNIALPIWGVGAAPRGCFPPADGEGAALPPGRQELNPAVLGARGTGPDPHPRPGEESGELRDAGTSLPQHNARCIPWNKQAVMDRGSFSASAENFKYLYREDVTEV